MHQSFVKIRSSLVDRLPYQGDPESLATQVKRLSDLYIERKTDFSRIWSEAGLTQAYLNYFLPLNLLRLQSVVTEAQSRGFFAGLENLIDFGSGPGTVDLALWDLKPELFKTSLFIESGAAAVHHHREFLKNLGVEAHSRQWVPTFKGPVPTKTLASFSYAFNEVTELPTWAESAEALLFIEPSTQDSGRRLQELRQKLILKGFSAWAPCTHNKPCPLLTFSKTDWCHQRVHVELNKRLLEIERHLPIKNQTLTYSYLLMRKTPPTPTTMVRVIGDTLYERGKVRQAVCRGDQREFLTWLTRHGEPEPLPRGLLLTLPEGVEEKGPELRMPPPPDSPKD